MSTSASLPDIRECEVENACAASTGRIATVDMRHYRLGDVLMTLPALMGAIRDGCYTRIELELSSSLVLPVGLPPQFGVASKLVPFMPAPCMLRPQQEGVIHLTWAWARLLNAMPCRMPLHVFGRHWAREQLWPGRDWAVISPWADAETKRWTVLRWAELCNALTSRGYFVALIGPERAIRYNRLIDRTASQSGCGPMLDLTGKCTPNTWASLVDRASMVVTPDTACAHLADALGVPCVSLYGGTDPSITGPFWNWDGIIRGNSMESISVDDILSRLD